MTLTKKERAERDRLHKKWMAGKATMYEMTRAMELDRIAQSERLRKSYK